MKHLHAVKAKKPKGSKVYILPNLFTMASLFSGFYAMIAAINGLFFHSAVAIIIAAVCDGLDGRVARFTGTTSKFGMELDSLCDMASFGIAPALLSYLWALRPYGRYGWLAAFLFAATCALRLARFNAHQDDAPSRNFTGLPCPAAAGMVAATVLFCRYLGLVSTVKHVAILLLVYSLSYLMVSNHTYLSFKHPHVTGGKSFAVMVGMVLVLVLVASEPPLMLFIVGLLYVFSGPLLDLYRKLRPEKADDPAVAGHEKTYDA